MSDALPAPYGGALVNPLIEPEQAAALRRDATDVESWDLTPAQLVDLELLLTGVYSPLRGFMSEPDFARCVSEGRLADGTPWPRPLALEVPDALAARLSPGASLFLRDLEGVPLACVSVDAVWEGGEPARGESRWHVAGRVEGLQLPIHHDFTSLRHTPASTREAIATRGWERTLAVFVPSMLHTPLVEGTLAAADTADAGLLVLALVPPSGPGDAEHFGRVRALRAAFDQYPADRALLVLLPWDAPVDDRRGRLARAIAARNLGCTHVAEPPDETSEMPPEVGAEVGVVTVDLEVPSDVDAQIASRLREGTTIPASLAFPTVVEELRRWHAVPRRRGFTVFFTGLSGSGKSTIANLLRVRLLEHDERQVSLLDGDVVRKHLSSELGFSREHRELNVRRIAYVASEITKNGGVAICAPIAPFDDVRRDARRMVEAFGDFVLVFVDTPLEICETRDPKGLYAKARAGLIPTFTGVSDPYERPDDADLIVDTTQVSAAAAADRVIGVLQQKGYIAAWKPSTDE